MNKNERQDEASSQNTGLNTEAVTGLSQSTGSELDFSEQTQRLLDRLKIHSRGEWKYIMGKVNSGEYSETDVLAKILSYLMPKIIPHPLSSV
jgi:hypothetical protein